MKAAAHTPVHPLFALAMLVCRGCPGTGPDGTTTLGTPAQCSAAGDCGEGIACLFPNGMDQPGVCDVEEIQVSSGTPALCNSDEDCPEGIGCIFTDGEDLIGYCDVEETQAQ